MEIIRAFALLVFLLFCILITRKYWKLKSEGISVSTKNSRLNMFAIMPFLLLFLFAFVSELVVQNLRNSFSFLPNFLQQSMHNSALLEAFGAALIILSVFCMHFTLSKLNKSLRFGIDANNLGELVTTGIFAYSRNPFFVSIVLQFVGIALAIPTTFFVGTATLSTISIHFFILKEERFMLASYGEKYEEYRNKVRRYF